MVDLAKDMEKALDLSLASARPRAVEGGEKQMATVNSLIDQLIDGLEMRISILRKLKATL